MPFDISVGLNVRHVIFGSVLTNAKSPGSCRAATCHEPLVAGFANSDIYYVVLGDKGRKIVGIISTFSIWIDAIIVYG